MDQVRWGIIGCGNVTEIKSGPAFQQIEGSSLVAVMRRNGDLAADYARRHHVQKWYEDADQLIRDPEVNAVYIATPPSSHKKYTIAAANAGKPIYVEKPMALNNNECQEMIKACRDNNVPLFVAYYRRALPRFLKIKSLLDEGTIEETRFINVTFCKESAPKDFDEAENWRINPLLAGGGYFYDLACHSIDLLQFFFGELKSAQGFASNQQKIYNAEDIVTGTLVFENLIHVSFIWNFNAYGSMDRTEIIGDRGKIMFSTFSNDPIILENENGHQQFVIENSEHIQQPLIQTIVDELRGIGQCPSTGMTGAKTNWIMDCVTQKQCGQ